MKSKSAHLDQLLLSTKQAAEMLAISKRKLWSMTVGGELPHLRIGRSVRYPVGDLQTWIAKNTKGGAE